MYVIGLENRRIWPPVRGSQEHQQLGRHTTRILYSAHIVDFIYTIYFIVIYYMYIFLRYIHVYIAYDPGHGDQCPVRPRPSYTLQG